jgi:imidazolonepropionase-like amidohydrolase
VALYEAYDQEGLTPIAIIHAATRDAAELLDLQDRLGTLEPGKQADIIAVPGDPLARITAPEHALRHERRRHH